MQHGGIRAHELSFDGVLLEHQVVAFQFHVGIGIMPCQVALYFIHVVYQGVR